MTHGAVWLISTARSTLFPASFHSQKCIFSFNKGFTHRNPSALTVILLCEVDSELFLERVPASCLRSVFHELEIIRFHLTFWVKFSFPHIHDPVVSFRLTVKFKYRVVICQNIWCVIPWNGHSEIESCDLSGVIYDSSVLRSQSKLIMSTLRANTHQFYAFCLCVLWSGEQSDLEFRPQHFSKDSFWLLFPRTWINDLLEFCWPLIWSLKWWFCILFLTTVSSVIYGCVLVPGREHTKGEVQHFF